MDKNKEKSKQKIIVAISIFIILSSFVVAFSVLYAFVLKPQGIYNEALSLYDNGSYSEALQELQDIEWFRGSKELIEQCQEQIDMNK